MNRPNSKILLVSVLALLATASGAYALMAKNGTDSASVIATDSYLASENGLGGTQEPILDVEAPVPGRAELLIDDELAPHRAFIEARWADGANLADHYVQMTVPCGRDCYRLIIGDTLTGQIVDTGMGDASMPELDADSMRSSDLLLLSWINLAGANCRRGIYRWNGQVLEGVSDLLDFEYTDAGCAQTNLAAAMQEMD